MKTYTFTICGLTRKIPLVHNSKRTLLANVTFLGDIELVNCLADKLAAICKDMKADFFVCPHVKVTPLVHGVALRLGHKRFVVLRKGVKPYMDSPVILRPLPDMPKHVQPLVINGPDARLLKEKNVIVIDDVISTGTTMRMVSHLMEMVGARVICSFAVIRQGNTALTIPNLRSLYDIPIFKNDTV
ncbi:MAG: phosphoribosyltransferase family protein [Candidatus Gottesmanbacteria bacterium]|nr:phosphoribosyltransferase family protein [Candidatus Gottesmanbacteria bacterium]